MAAPIGPSTQALAGMRDPIRTQRASDTPESRATAAERDASRRIQEAERHIAEAQRSADQRIEEARDNYERQYEKQNAQEQNSLEQERMKGYEAMRDLKKHQNDELRKVRKEGERAKSELENHYRDAVYKSERDGKQTLDEIKVQHDRAQYHERVAAQMAEEQLKTEQKVGYNHVKEQGEERLESLNKTYAKEVEDLRQSTHAAKMSAEEKFNDQYKHALDAGQERMEEVINRSAEKLKNLRSDTAPTDRRLRLSPARSFYRMRKINAYLHDRGDAYVLRARVPEHEQKGFSVSIKGESLVLAGYRASNEKVVNPDGSINTSSGHQAYTETIPLSWPVHARELRKEFIGDELVVTIPKKETNYRAPQHVKSPGEKPRIERPQFPEVAKVVEDHSEPKAEKEELRAAVRTKSSGHNRPRIIDLSSRARVGRRRALALQLLGHRIAGLAKSAIGAQRAHLFS